MEPGSSTATGRFRVTRVVPDTECGEDYHDSHLRIRIGLEL